MRVRTSNLFHLKVTQETMSGMTLPYLLWFPPPRGGPVGFSELILRPGRKPVNLDLLRRDNCLLAQSKRDAMVGTKLWVT